MDEKRVMRTDSGMPNRGIRHKGTVTILIALLLLGGPAAIGSTRKISDPNDVAKHRVDIKSVSAGHARNKLKHKIVAFRRFRTSRGPCLTIESKPRAGRDYQVCGFGNMTNLHQQETKPSVTFRRPNRRTIVYLFRPRAIGGPNVYKWYVVEAGNDRCEECDRAPNRGMVRHALN